MTTATNNWRGRRELHNSKWFGWYCRNKGQCHFKHIQKSRKTKGLYNIHCISKNGCVEKTLYPVRIDLRPVGKTRFKENFWFQDQGSLKK